MANGTRLQHRLVRGTVRVLMFTMFLLMYQTAPGYPQGQGCQAGDTHCLLRSNWANSLGNSDAALTDGGVWDVPAEWGGMPGNTDEVNVVDTTAPQGLNPANSLRVQQQGPTNDGWCRVKKANFTPPSTDYYLRYYIRNDDVGGTTQDHVVQPGIVGNIYNDLTYLNKGEFAGGWRPRMVLGGNQAPNSAMPNWQLANDTALAYGRWYRFEYWVHFTAASRIQVRVRIYDAANVLRFTEADFVPDPDYSPMWAGATLESYYAGTNPGGGISDFGITPLNLVNIEFGNNGSDSATDTRPNCPNCYWYYAAVEIRDDTWPGPVGWSAANTGITGDVFALAIDPVTTSTVYAAGNGGAFKSTNGGGTWTAINTGMTSSFVKTLAIDPVTPNTLYAGTTGGGVFKSTNGGGS